MKNVIFNQKNLLFVITIVLAGCLRLIALDQSPPALYSDEVSQGYNAYLIAKTGTDEYKKFLPMSLRSFGDWKPPLQTYLMIPTIILFGLNVWGVRLPTAILGTLTVLVVYFLVEELSEKLAESRNRNLSPQYPTSYFPLLTSLLLAISPWHILQSRSAMLVGVALFFYCAGLWSFIKGLRQRRYLYISSISFVLAMYGYYGMRVIVPLTIIGYTFLFRKELIQQKKSVFVSIILGLCLLLPLGIAFMQESNVLFGRVKTVSVFYDKGVALTVWDLIAQDGVAMPSKLAQFLHNKPYHYFIDILRRFFEHLDGRFLFIIGDQNPPFQIPNQGVLYLFDGLFLLVGSIYLIRSKAKLFQFLILLITISIIPAALTYVTPASNRTLTMVVPLIVIVSFGIFCICKYMKKWGAVLVVMIYSVSLAYFLHNYFVILPKEHASWWHYGYKELYSYLYQEEGRYEQIAISGKISVPYIFLLFYRQIDPQLIDTEIKRNYNADEFGFEHVDAFGRYSFPRYFTWEEDGERLPNNSLLVVGAHEEVGKQAHEVYRILYPNNDVVFKVYKIEND